MLPSIFEIFKIGIGPSSSHTLGALNCAKAFINEIKEIITKSNSEFSLNFELSGSFSLTGKGHLTHYAAVAGLNNYKINVNRSIKEVFKETNKNKYIKLGNKKILFDPEKDILWNNSFKDLKHPNTIKFTLLQNNKIVYQSNFVSIGGGNIRKLNNKNIIKLNFNNLNINEDSQFNNINKFADIIKYCKYNNIDILQFLFKYHEQVYNIKQNIIKRKTKNMWQIMQNVLENGLNHDEILPGKLKLQRKAKILYNNFIKSIRSSIILSNTITLASIYAISIAEENASGSIIITSPTCGSAGILPAVLKTLKERYFLTDNKIINAILVAGIIGAIVFKNGSISGAEVGCQGEIGTASGMAAAAAAYLLGGTLDQIEYAAEIALEHHLGLTCDPVEGLVQIPCIERNAVGAVTALNAANIAILTTSTHHISLDDAVIAMKETGMDMNNKYKETSLGGLAKIFKC